MLKLPRPMSRLASLLAVSAARLIETNRIGPLPADAPFTAKVRSLAKPVPVALDGEDAALAEVDADGNSIRHELSFGYLPNRGGHFFRHSPGFFRWRLHRGHDAGGAGHRQRRE